MELLLRLRAPRHLQVPNPVRPSRRGDKGPDLLPVVEEGAARREASPPKEGQKTDLKEVPCYFHSAAKYGAGKGCSKGAACSFSHSKFLSKADFEAAERPSRSASASRRKEADKGKPSPPKPRPPSAGAGKRTVPFHCNKFLKDGTCPFGEQCKFPHLTKAHYDEELAKMKADAAAGTGKT